MIIKTIMMMNTEVTKRKYKKKAWRPYKPNATKEEIVEYKALVEIYETAKVKWLKEIKHPDNIRDWILPNTPITYERIAKELWHSNTKLTNMSKTPEVKEHRKEVKKDLFKEMQTNSEKVLSKTFDLENWWFDMKDSERARLALDFKKATDKAYNPTQSIDLSVNDLDFSNLEELKSELAEELWLLKANNEE